MTNYKCPVCGASLGVVGKSYVCAASHTFDIAKEGYVNLALGKSDSGDSTAMCVSRRNFLSKGYYEKFARLICDTVEKHLVPDVLCDAGCGEGYYLREMRKRFPDAEMFGIDLAKEAVKLAAKSEKQSTARKNLYSVCGIFSLPFPDDALDAVISVFAPVGDAENRRVLRDGGFMFVAGPGREHLSGLKNAIYERPYANEEKHREYDGFSYLGKETVSYTVTVAGEDILDLFTMTPYYWKTSKEDSAKLASLPQIDTKLEFEVSVYKKSERFNNV